MEYKIKQFLQAKDNVRYLLDYGESLVDMHGLKYWAGEVERLRNEINEQL